MKSHQAEHAAQKARKEVKAKVRKEAKRRIVEEENIGVFPTALG